MFPGDEILLDVDSLALSGEGIAKREGLVFFVDGALPGEEVRSQIVKVERNLVRVKTLEVLKKSSARTVPVCEHFGRCGGCAFQHLSYEAQLQAKQKALEEIFRHLGGFENVHVQPVIPSPKPYHYRNTVAMTIRHRNHNPYLGFIGKDNRSFISVEHCPIAEERLNIALPSVLQKFLENIPKKKRYRTSQIAIRVGMNGEVYTSLGDKKESQPLGATICGKVFRFSGSSFFQTNFSILERLVETVRELLEPSLNHDLLDLYCGVGLFALSFADGYQNVLGIEEGEQAISFARENASANGITNTRFVSGKTEDTLQRVPEFLRRVSHVVIDPPRVGMKREAVEQLLAMSEVERLVYVSCDPGTLIRDLKIFSTRFKIETVQPLDMFPQTAHLETVVLLLPRS